MKKPTLADYVAFDADPAAVDRMWKDLAVVRARDRFLQQWGPMLYGGGVCLALLGVFAGARLLSSDEPRRERRHVAPEPREEARPEPVVVPAEAPDAAPPRSDAGAPPAPAVALVGAVPLSQGDAAVRVLVRPDGSVALEGTRGGQPVKPEALTGTVTLTPLGGGAPRRQALAPKGGQAVAELGALDAPLQDLRADLVVGGAPLEGSVVLPRGGTPALEDAAKAAAKARVKPGAKGPHGGVLQVVGPDVIEVVGKKGSGDLRVWVLDDALKPKKVGPRKVSLALQGAAGPAVVALAPDASGDYLVGKAPTAESPRAISVLVEDGARADCALVGWAPGAVIVVGPAAPVVAIFVVDTWDVVVLAPAPPIVVIEPRYKFKGKKGKHWR